MSRFSRKFVAVLMLLWLPLFGSSALAATVSMQMQGSCQGMSAMQHQDMTGHGHAAPIHDRQGNSCNDCGVCHVACSGYLAVSTVVPAALQQDGRVSTPYLVSFSSVTPALLDPPPLARL